MNLISISEGKCGVLIRFSDIAPLSGLYLPDLTNAIVHRYAFTSSPDFSPVVLEKKGVEFLRGKFCDSNGVEHNIQSLNLYNDGVVASCFSTEAAALLIDDLFSWASESFDFRIPEQAFNKLYLLSTIIVQFEAEIVSAFSKLDSLLKGAAQALVATYDLDMPLSVSSLSFDFDHSAVGGVLASLSPFVIERQINEPHSSNRFFCQAPIHTQEHIRLLKSFELAIKD
jgi:hypothetical protein